MTWIGWFVLGVITGVAVAALLVACVGRESHERGGTLDFTSRDARRGFKRAREASALPGTMRTWRPGDGWPLPIIADENVPLGYVELRDERGIVSRHRLT